MAVISNQVVDLIESSTTGCSPEDVGRRFFQSLRPFGLTAIYARAYGTSGDPVLSEHVFARIAPASFVEMYADQRFYDHNPLPREMRRRSEPFRWSDLPWRSDHELWIRQAMRDCGCPDGLAIPCQGPNNYVGLVSLALDRLDGISPADRAAIELAAHVVHGRMRALAGQRGTVTLASLTARERDCLAFIAEGRSNAQIAASLNLSPATVATHVANARAKLGAKTRSQAVACYLSATLR